LLKRDTEQLPLRGDTFVLRIAMNSKIGR